MITLDKVNKRYGAQHVLKDVYATFDTGRIHGIVGRNGSGKTVMLRVICGLTRADSGEVTIDGHRIGRDMEVPPSVGAIINEPGLLPEHSAYQNLRLLASVKGIATPGRIREVIEQVGLDPNSRKRVGKYSLGMKQRLGIAQALMEDPAILLLDEPMNGLDNAGVREMRELFKALRDKGKTILLASHNPLDIEELCDSVYEMDGGVLTRVR